MKAVMYGGGNIGRGFIGALLSQSGYEVTFIDVAEPVIEALCRDHRYPIRLLSGDKKEDVWVENVTAVNGNDTEAASEAIAQCDIMATAVGARILKFIVPNIVAGLRKRWQSSSRPLNIIICENLNDANKILEGMLRDQLTAEEQTLFDETVGLVEASIGRMVPVQTEEMKDGEPMRVCVEPYGFLPVDAAAFKGEIPEIKNLVPYEPFDFYIKRKLFVHNMGHATCAYLGDLMGLQYIYEAVAVPGIRLIAQNAMTESAMALSVKYGADLSALLVHVDDLLFRFTNKALGDTCQRVGGDPSRKLSPADRMIGSASLALECSITPAYIALGAAAGVYRYIQESEKTQSEQAAGEVLCGVSGLEAGGRLYELIMDYYRMIADGCGIDALRAKAEQIRHESRGAVV